MTSKYNGKQVKNGIHTLPDFETVGKENEELLTGYINTKVGGGREEENKA